MVIIHKVDVFKIKGLIPTSLDEERERIK